MVCLLGALIRAVHRASTVCLLGALMVRLPGALIRAYIYIYIYIYIYMANTVCLPGAHIRGNVMFTWCLYQSKYGNFTWCTY